MNLLKALAKMTKLAAGLEHELRIARHDFAEEKNKRLLTDQVATERYDLVKSLEAKLYAAEQNATSRMHFEAVTKLNALGYAWSVPDGRWFDPLPQAPVAATPDPTQTPWHLHPWATHQLRCGVSHVFAELVNGEYLGPPDSDVGHGRLKYHVGLNAQDFKVVEVRPGYDGPRTRGLRPPEFVEVGPAAVSDTLPVNLCWPLRATHYLYNPNASGSIYYFAELHDGVYYQMPWGECGERDWEWDRRGSFTVGPEAWKIVEVRP